MSNSWFRAVAPCCLLLAVAGCGSVDDQAAQRGNSDVVEQTDKLLRKQDAFLQRARDLFLEIEALRIRPGWTGVVHAIHVSQSSRTLSTFAMLTRQWKSTGDDTYVQARRLLEQSEALEGRRQTLLKEWTDAMVNARSAISTDQYNTRQLKAVVGNTELFYEMNKTALNRFALDESGFLMMVLVRGANPIRPSGLSGK